VTLACYSLITRPYVTFGLLKSLNFCSNAEGINLD
jgi:hypothetical protein